MDNSVSISGTEITDLLRFLTNRCKKTVRKRTIIRKEIKIDAAMFLTKELTAAVTKSALKE